MDSAQVIKAKYGDTLRRFTTYVNENGVLDLDMDGLRMKICSLFRFPFDADLTLTYVDKDKDEVTLVDDDDLRDVTRQHLNPLRINVLLKSIRFERSDSKLNKSPAFKGLALERSSSSVHEVSKSAEESIFSVFSKLSHDLTTNATSLVLNKLVESLSKLKLSDRSPVSGCQGGASLCGEKSTADSSTCPKATKDTELRKRHEEKAVSCLANFLKASESGSVNNKPVGNSISSAACPEDLNGDHPSNNSTASAYSKLNIPDPASASDALSHNDKAQQENAVNLHGKSIASGTSASTVDDWNKFQFLQIPLPRFPGSSALIGENTQNYPGGIQQFYASQANINPDENFPVIGVLSDNSPPYNGFTARDSYNEFPSLYKGGSFNKGYCCSDSSSRVFHKCIQCDGCGVHRIIGPRFKSKVKEDYDLCSTCFSDLGNEAEYVRLNHQHPIFGQASMGYSRKMFNSLFVYDVNVVDRTSIAPNVMFTKKWRMRNNGAAAWPSGTQLNWIGGDRLTDKVSVEVEVPVDGFPVNKELDIAVKFTAPRPGRYISYWRMSLPSGEAFGEQIWVFMQVDASLQGLADGFNGINLNFPPNTFEAEGKETIDVDGSLPRTSHSKVSTKAVVEQGQNNDQNIDLPANDDSIIGNGVLDPSKSNQCKPTSNLGIDSSRIPSDSSPVTDTSVVFSDVLERLLLEELEQMGFKRIDLNKEILRMNAYDLEQSIADLCGVAEWDQILKELEEMGFCDKETNKKLVIQNAGSIKNIVMDLI